MCRTPHQRWDAATRKDAGLALGILENRRQHHCAGVGKMIRKGAVMSEFAICYRLDGIYWRCRTVERRISNRQAVRLMSLIWSGDWQTEAVTVFRREKHA